MLSEKLIEELLAIQPKERLLIGSFPTQNMAKTFQKEIDKELKKLVRKGILQDLLMTDIVRDGLLWYVIVENLGELELTKLRIDDEQPDASER